MTKIEGYIESIKPSCSPKGPSDWENWTFKVNSISYGTFDKKMVSFKVGDFVGLDYEENGKFKNIVTMVEIPIADEKPAELDTPTKNIDKAKILDIALKAFMDCAFRSEKKYETIHEAMSDCSEKTKDFYQKFLAWLE